MAPLSLAADFARAVGQLGDRRFAGVLAKGIGLTVVALALVFWAVVAGLGWLLPETVALPWIGEVGFVDDLASWAAVGLMLVLSVVLMVPVAAIVVGFFLEDIAAAVEARHYPRLAPAAGVPLGTQVADGLRFFGVLVAANLVAGVIYFAVPPLAPFVFWIVNGYLLGREYFQLVAMRRLGPEGAAALRRDNAARVWFAGVLMAIPLSVPVVNLLVPVLGVAVFTHQFHRLAR
jgi:CysZ protein